MIIISPECVGSQIRIALLLGDWYKNAFVILNAL